MSDIKSDDIALKDVGVRLKNLILVFADFIIFICKKWYIFAFCFLIGFLLLYIKHKINDEKYVTSALIRANNGSTEYIYETIEHLNNNVRTNEELLLPEKFKTNDIVDLSIQPVVNFKDILDKYDSEDNGILKSLLENASAEDIIESSFFRSEYKFHKIYIIKTNEAAGVESLLDYLNGNDFYRDSNKAYRLSLEENISEYEYMKIQIDSFLSSHNNTTKDFSDTKTPVNVQLVDMQIEMKDIINAKQKILLDIQSLKQELINTEDPVLLVSTSSSKDMSKDNDFLIIVVILFFLYLTILTVMYRNKHIKSLETV